MAPSTTPSKSMSKAIRAVPFYKSLEKEIHREFGGVRSEKHNVSQVRSSLVFGSSDSVTGLDVGLRFSVQGDEDDVAPPYGTERWAKTSDSDPAELDQYKPESLAFRPKWGDVDSDYTRYLSTVMGVMQKVRAEEIALSKAIRSYKADQLKLVISTVPVHNHLLYDRTRVTIRTTEEDVRRTVKYHNVQVLGWELSEHLADVATEFLTQLTRAKNVLGVYVHEDTIRLDKDAMETWGMVASAYWDIRTAIQSLQLRVALKLPALKDTDIPAMVADRFTQTIKGRKAVRSKFYKYFDEDERLSDKWEEWRERTLDPTLDRQNSAHGAARTQLFGAFIDFHQNEIGTFEARDWRDNVISSDAAPSGVKNLFFIEKGDRTELTTGLHLLGRLVDYEGDASSALKRDWMPRWDQQEAETPSPTEMLHHVSIDNAKPTNTLPHGEAVLRAAKGLRQVMNDQHGSACRELASKDKRIHDYSDFYKAQSRDLVNLSRDLLAEIVTERDSLISDMWLAMERRFLDATRDEIDWIKAMSLNVATCVEPCLQDLKKAIMTLEGDTKKMTELTRTYEQGLRRMDISREMLIEQAQCGHPDWSPSTTYEQWLEQRALDHPTGSEVKAPRDSVKQTGSSKKSRKKRYYDDADSKKKKNGTVSSEESAEPLRLPPPTKALYRIRLLGNKTWLETEAEGSEGEMDDPKVSAIEWSVPHQSWRYYVKGDRDPSYVPNVEDWSSHICGTRGQSYQSSHVPLPRHARDPRQIKIGSAYHQEPQPAVVPETRNQVVQPRIPGRFTMPKGLDLSAASREAIAQIRNIFPE